MSQVPLTRCISHVALLHRMRSLTAVLNGCEHVADGSRTCLRGVARHPGWPLGRLLVICRHRGDLPSSSIRHAGDPERFASLEEAGAGLRWTTG